MKRKRVISLIMTVALLMAAIPLNTFADEKVLTDIDIVKNEQAVNYKGQPFNSSSICVTAIYDDGSSSFISDEEYDIANYNSDKAGQVEITIAYGGLSKDVLIDITDSDFLYPIGKEVSLSVMSGTDAVAFWKSSDENIFEITDTKSTWAADKLEYKQTVDIKTLNSGVAVLTCSTSDGRLVGEAVISVSKPVEKLSVTEEIYAITGQQYELDAVMAPADADEQRVSWSSSDMDIVVVSRQGTVTAKKVGDAIITASSWDGKHTAECIVHVIEPGSFKPEDIIFAKSDNVRIFGSNRYETSIKAADEMKKGLGISKFDNIIVASGDNYADALSGSYLAKIKKAPVLVIGADWPNQCRAYEYINKNLSTDGAVYILGGTGAVSEEFEKALSGLQVKRLSGEDRWMTNLAILQETGLGEDGVVVCSGTEFADSLSASAAGRPILLVDEILNERQREYVAAQNVQYCLIGGEGAVSRDVEDEMAQYGETKRVEGVNRFETSAAVAREFFGVNSERKPVVFAYGENFPDGLSGGPLAMVLGAPVILIDNRNIKPAGDYVKDSGVYQSIVMGGPALINADSIEKIMN